MAESQNEFSCTHGNFRIYLGFSAAKLTGHFRLMPYEPRALTFLGRLYIHFFFLQDRCWNSQVLPTTDPTIFLKCSYDHGSRRTLLLTILRQLLFMVKLQTTVSMESCSEAFSASETTPNIFSSGVIRGAFHFFKQKKRTVNGKICDLKI